MLGTCAPPDDQAYLETGTPGKFGETLFRQDPLHGSNGDLYSLLGKQLRDLTGGEITLSPGTDLLPDLICYPVTRDTSLGDRLREVEFAGNKQMSQEMDVSTFISEAFCYPTGREAVYKGGSKGFISSLPVMDRVREEGRVGHEILIQNDGYDVKI